MQGLTLWIYGLFLEIVEFIADSLLEVFNMDLAYFESNVPVTRDIVAIIIAAGWALLIGNLAFQALKTMMSGIGFEGEDPKILFCRTFVFSFLLAASRQICELGLGITAHLNTLLQTPDAVRLNLPPLDVFAINGSWLLVMIIGLILMFQIVKFFFEVAERYVVLVVLTILAPLAFGIGGSKNTEDIFKGWARMFGSACLMMLFNTIFLKLLLSGMSNIPPGPGMLPWMMLIVAIARVARKIDDMVSRIGLNVARTGDPISHGGIMYPVMVMRTLGSLVSKTMAANKVTPNTPGTGRQRGGAPMPPPPPSGGGGNSGNGGSGGVSSPHGGAASGDTSTRRHGSEQNYPNVPGAQPAMSAASAGNYGASGKEMPSRPPVGGRRERAAPGRTGDMFSDKNRQTESSAKPPLSVDSAVLGGVASGRMDEQRSDKAPENSVCSGMNKDDTHRGVPPLSVDSRRPDMQGRANNREQDEMAGRATHGLNEASPTRQSYRPNRKSNIDIYREDDPVESTTAGAGMRGGKAVAPPGGSQRADSPPAPSRATGVPAGSQVRPAANAVHTQNPVRNTANVAKSGVNVTRTESHSSATTSGDAENTIRNTAKDVSAYSGIATHSPGHVASPVAGRVSRGVGTQGVSGRAAVPGGAQRMVSTPTPNKNDIQNHLPQITKSVNRSSDRVQSNSQQPVIQTDIRPDMVYEGHTRRERPMRYRMAGYSNLNKPERPSQSRRNPMDGGGQNP